MNALYRFFYLVFLIVALSTISNAQSIIKGTVSFFNSGSRPAVGVKISTFGSHVYTTDAGMFFLELPNKKPGDKVTIIIGNQDRNNTPLELVNQDVLSNLYVPSETNEFIEIIVCKLGERDEAAIRYNGIIVETIVNHTDERLSEIREELKAAKIDAETIISLQNEKQQLITQRDSALAKAEEQAVFIANINLDKAGELVKVAINKVDSLEDIRGAIAVLDNEILYQTYQEANQKKKKANIEIDQVIIGLRLKITLLKPLYNYREIAACYEIIAKIFEEEKNDYEILVSSLDSVAYYWDASGAYEKAVAASLKALSVRDSFTEKDYVGLAKSHQNLAYTYTNLGEFQKALDYSLKSLAIWEKTTIMDSMDLVKIYGIVGDAYRNLAICQEALDFNLKSISIADRLLSPTHIELALSYNNLATTYNACGQDKKALTFTLKATDIFQKILPENHPFLGRSYNNTASIYSRLGDYQKQREFSLKALKIRESTLPPNHPELAASYNSLASTFEKFGEYEQQLEYNLKALVIFEKVLPADHPELALTYNNLGTAYLNLNKLEESIEHYLKSLYIFEKILPDNHPNLATLNNNIGHIYLKNGNKEQALKFVLKALIIFEKVLPPNHPDLASIYNNIAVLYGDLEQFQKQLEFNLKSLKIREKVLPEGHPQLAISYSNIGGSYIDIGNIVIGVEYNEKAVKIGEESNPKLPFLNILYANLGIAYLKATNYSDAKISFEKSELLNKDHERVCRGWAMYYAIKNNPEESIEYLQNAISSGYKDLKWIETESLLDNIREEKGYINLVTNLRKTSINVKIQ